MGKRRGPDPGGGAGSDEGTGLFFLLAMLVCIVVPWTLALVWTLLTPGKKEVLQAFPTTTESGARVRQCNTQAMVLKRESQIQQWRSRGRLLARGFVLRLVILGLLWCWLLYIVHQIQTVKANSALYQNFDPYDILSVGRSASAKEVKKAFRGLSLKYHPDKNPGMEEKFMLIKKAMDALTDPIAKRNFALYGNPDGPVRMEVGVAIPLIDKSNQGLVLILFVIFFILGVPLTFLWCMTAGSNTGANGVLNDTMDVLKCQVNDKLRTRTARDLVGNSNESRSSHRNTTAEEMQAVGNLWKEMGGGTGGRKVENTDFSVMKGEMLLLAHLHRRSDLLSPELLADMECLLPKWHMVSTAIVNLSSQKSMDATTEALRSHRCLIQGLDAEAQSSGPMPLLQVPHFTEEGLKQWRKGPRKAASLLSLLEMPADERRTSLEKFGFEQQELVDIEEFVAVAPRLVIKETKVFVEDHDADGDPIEAAPCAGDIATLRVKLERQNLREGEAAGAVHAPLFPSAALPEAWWLLFTPSSKGTTFSCTRLINLDRQIEVLMKFQVKQIGKHRCSFRIVSEAYEGLDLEHQLTFDAKKPPEDRDPSGDEDEDDEDE